MQRASAGDQPAPHPYSGQLKRKRNMELVWKQPGEQEGVVQVSTRTSLQSHPSPTLSAKQSFSSLHPIPCPSYLQSKRRIPKAKVPKDCLHSNSVTQLWEAPSPCSQQQPHSQGVGRGQGGQETGLTRAEQWERRWQCARVTATRGMSSTGDAECGHVGKLRRMWPGSAICQFSPHI